MSRRLESFPMSEQTLRFAYADPPYPGQAHLYKDHPDYDGEVDHTQLAFSLTEYDGWCLHTSSVSLHTVLDDVKRYHPYGSWRVMAWVKPFAAFKRNVPVAYAWEPVIVKAIRKPVVSERLVLRDWIAEPITMKRGLAGAKPAAVCRWIFEVAGLDPDDELIDLFPGTGAVSAAWETWRNELRLAV